MDPKSYLNLEEVAAITSKSIQTLRRLIKKGDLKAKRIRTPQGFQYVVNPEALSKLGYIMPQKLMFSNSTIQNDISTQHEAVEDVAPYQAENLYSRMDLESLKEDDFYHLDIQNFKTLQNDISSSHNVQTDVAQVSEIRANRFGSCTNLSEKQQVCAYCANLEVQAAADRLKIESLELRNDFLEKEKNEHEKFAKDMLQKNHKERMFFLQILERLQNELMAEREKRNVFVNVFQRLSNRIKLAIKNLSS